jgi:hypothetical protein
LSLCRKDDVGIVCMRCSGWLPLLAHLSPEFGGSLHDGGRELEVLKPAAKRVKTP